MRDESQYPPPIEHQACICRSWLHSFVNMLVPVNQRQKQNTSEIMMTPYDVITTFIIQRWLMEKCDLIYKHVKCSVTCVDNCWASVSYHNNNRTRFCIQILVDYSFHLYKGFECMSLIICVTLTCRICGSKDESLLVTRPYSIEDWSNINFGFLIEVLILLCITDLVQITPYVASLSAGSPLRT